MWPDEWNEPNTICGIYGRDITEPVAETLGQAIGTRMAGGRMVVGGDTRPSTPALKQALVDGLLKTGCEVYDVGTLPTPALSFAKDRFWADGAVMVTASHRPIEENGFKITLGKLPTTATEIRELQEMVSHQGPFASGSGQQHIQDTLGPYISFLVARFVPADPLRVVVDAGNGSMHQVAVAVLRSLGYQVVERTFESDTLIAPNPALPENQAILRQLVLEHQAHLGIAFDADGDQVLFVDQAGHTLKPEHALILLARALIVYQPGSRVMYDDSFSPFVEHEVRKLGGIPTPVHVISSELKRDFLEHGAILGGDHWGHYFFRAMGGDDALYAALVILRFIGRLNPATR